MEVEARARLSGAIAVFKMTRCRGKLGDANLLSRGSALASPLTEAGAFGGCAVWEPLAAENDLNGGRREKNLVRWAHQEHVGRTQSRHGALTSRAGAKRRPDGRRARGS